MQSHVVLGQGDSANRKIRERGKSRKGMKTTPFKRPRQLLRTGKRPEQLIEASKRTCRAVPNVAIPRLLKSGRFECRQRHHHEGSQHVPAAQCGSLNFLVQPGCLKRCLDFSFQKSSFGCISCLPAEITTTLHLDSVDEFRVDDCIDWMTSLYPGVSQEPAPCVGSVAWTKLTYGLSVWKLGRLDLTCKWGHRFLTVANVIREFLRRFSIEWHGNRQPHLLRMMRRDSAPASHVVLVIADIEEDAQKRLLLTLSDGWYLARAVLDPILEGRVLRGKLRIGEKIHVAGARLQSTSTRRELFCGDGDELCSSVLRICTNNVRKRKSSTAARLGIQRAPLCSNSLKWVRDDGGQCPATYAVILRSYPLFYMERVDRGHANEQDNALEYVFRREDAEFEARSTHEEIWRQRLPAAAEGKRTKVCGGHGDEIEVQRRSVSSVNEVLICGIADDPLDQSARKLVRIYNSTEDVQANLRGEGQVILFANLWPKKSRWTAKPDGVIIPRRITFSNLYSQYPRSICSIVDLQSGTQVAGMEFDGAFIALHVSSPTDAGDRRFAYFADELRSEICVLALELAGADVNFLPKTLRTTRYGRKFPVIALQNVQYQAISGKHDLVHAKATIRTSFISYQALHRKRAPGILKQVAMKVEGQISGKQAELEVLREAVVSFASGVRGSIGAYFTSTQES
ncbi:unnamed protein product [Chondrus crispus]|uniref:BRCA2 OB1 domain-containing protein n=1 Tax=Chondrus crispus TaxID=2769 RepID=R7QAL5_CHOCR|nr:unnamed protein product [Chondrus crispus]CDF34843.1 unnamed protein product [Chondrus crispus]|eukprot:XP_005714662.1 unnamed protein product [Chondrus crispus]